MLIGNTVKNTAKTLFSYFIDLQILDPDIT